MFGMPFAYTQRRGDGMIFKRLLGFGIATIICGLGAVGWADVKPIDPNTACLKYYSSSYPSLNDVTKYLAQYKVNASVIDGQYVVCFKQDFLLTIKGGLVFQPNSGDKIVIYGLQLKNDAANVSGFSFMTITGNDVLLQNIQLSGPGSGMIGSTGLTLSGSNLSIINSIITGFETGIQANCSAGCIIGSKNVTDNVKQGVVLPTTSQGVTITQNEIRTIYDPYGTGEKVVGTAQKIVLQGTANGGLTPPTFSVDPATMTIWKTLSADGKFATEVGGVLPKNGTIELFEHGCQKQPDLSCKYTDYFRASCPTIQNDKGQFEFKCTGLNIDAVNGQVFVDVTYASNTSAMTKNINVKDIPDKQITAAVNPGSTISGGSLTDAGSGQGTLPAGGDGGLVVGGAGETVAMNNPGPSDMGGSSAPPLPEGDGVSDSGSAAAMTGGAMGIGGDGAPSAAGASAGCGGQLMPAKTPADPILFAILLMPIVTLLRVRLRQK